ncbi:MAG: HEAT repeat domain-containing protein [Planctomycetota bacterium]
MARTLLTWAIVAGAAWGQSTVVWDDPRLEDALADADLVVLAQAVQVGANEVRYRVERTLKGPDRNDDVLRVQGLFHPDLADGPPSSPEERAFLILRGEPSGDSFLVPTPSFGRFPLRHFGPQLQVVACLGDTFVRLPLDPELYASFLQGVIAGHSTPLISAAREGLRAQLQAQELDSTALFVNLRIATCFGGPGDEPLLIQVLERPDLAGPDRYRLRMEVARGLGALHGPRALERLVTLARTDDVPAVQTVATQGLESLAAHIEQGAKRPLIAALVSLAQEATAEPTVFSGAEDPRKNVLPSPLSAALLALALHAPTEGVAPALSALERDDAEAVGAGLVFFQVLGERQPGEVPTREIALRMRSTDDPDADLNALFARTLRMLTGKDLGPERAAWVETLGGKQE